jgi:hypothetical protein
LNRLGWLFIYRDAGQPRLEYRDVPSPHSTEERPQTVIETGEAKLKRAVTAGYEELLLNQN